jgi:hypothetical protein
MTDTTDNAPERIWAVGLWNSEPGNWTGGHWDLHQDFSGDVEYRRADLPATDAQIMARIKPLVWEYHPAGAIAAPPTGHAYIIDTRMKGRCYSIKGFNPQREFSSMDEAKAAAQADYVARIMSALTTGDSND